MMWFCYERDHGGRWCPVVFHGDKPGKVLDGGRERTAPQPVPLEYIGAHAEPMWGALAAIFPAPREVDECAS